MRNRLHKRLHKQLLGASFAALSLAVLPASVFAEDAKTTRYEHYKMYKSSSNTMNDNQRRTMRSNDRSMGEQARYNNENPYRQAAPNFEDSRYQKWASMTAEERDLAKQRGEISYRDWQEFEAARDAQASRNARVERHYQDPWQGQTMEQKDASAQRNSVYERTHPEGGNQHHPDPWQGKTAEEKDMIKQRNSVPAHDTREYSAR